MGYDEKRRNNYTIEGQQRNILQADLLREESLLRVFQKRDVVVVPRRNPHKCSFIT